MLIIRDRGKKERITNGHDEKMDIIRGLITKTFQVVKVGKRHIEIGGIPLIFLRKGFF